MYNIELDHAQITVVQSAVNQLLSDTEWAEVFGPRAEVQILREVQQILADATTTLVGE